jgi:hypothetical protein
MNATLDKLFKPKTGAKLPADVRAAFDRIMQLLNNDALQNDLFISPLAKDSILKGLPCDEIPNPVGDFGRSPENPIPVNGIIGELTYLSRLKWNASGQQIIFHRLGSGAAGRGVSIDLYEVVTWDGQNWDILMLDMYHPVKSRLLPEGYSFAERVEGLTGTNKYLETFPQGLIESINEQFGVMLPSNPFIRKNINWSALKRPIQQRQLVEQIRQAIGKARRG